MNKRILIIGGMGAQASIALHERIIAKSIEKGAKQPDQLPMILHASLPVPDFVDSPENLASSLNMIRGLLYPLWRP